MPLPRSFFRRAERLRERRPGPLLIAGFLAALAAPLAEAGRDDEHSLARYTPADVGFFVELRGGADVLAHLTEPQLWTTLAELAGQPAQPEEANEWRRLVMQTVRMTPEEAIDALFRRRVAFFGEGPGRTRDAVVLCEPERDPHDLLKRWGARRLSSFPNPGAWQLYANIGASCAGQILVFGDLLPAEGAFRETLRLLDKSGAPSLAESQAYRELLARAPDSPDGVLFARLAPAAPTSAPETQSASAAATQPARRRGVALPGPLGGARNLLLALKRSGPRLQFTAIGDAAPSSIRPNGAARGLIERLPDQTLAAWAGELDYAAFSSTTTQGADGRANPLLLPAQREALERLTGQLTGITCVALGAVPRGDEPATPALAWLAEARNIEEAQLELESALGGWISLLDMLTTARGRQPAPPVRDEAVDGFSLHILDMKNLVEAFGVEAFGPLQICWTADGRTLIAATNVDWLKRILKSRGGGATLQAVASASDRAADEASVLNSVVVQTAPLADLAQAWLNYFQRVMPEVLTEEWWRARQPGIGGGQLGIDVEQQPELGRLRVQSVTRGLPSDGRLAPGDLIVGCNNQRFKTTTPIAEIRQAVQQRPHARYVELMIERDAREQRVRIPLPFVDPMQFLRRVSALGRVAERVVYDDGVDSAGGARGYLTLELRPPSKEQRPRESEPRP